VEIFTPSFEPAPITPIIEPAPFIPAPIMNVPAAIDPAMSWCSSTPETIEFSKTFVLPVETFNPVESWETPMQATASPQQKPII
jgi:hypothetical protein